jgi:hypothetical protein
MSTVVINKVAVDMADPCALWEALYAVKLRLLAGEEIEETEIRSPVSQNRIRIARASMDAIDAELRLLQAACEKKRTGKRIRYRKIMRF